MILDKSALSKPFHIMDPSEVLEMLGTSIDGLSSGEAADRIDIFGPNSLDTEKKLSFAARFVQQLKNFMVYVLTAAAIVAFIVGDYKSMVIIAAVVILNALLGVIQESKAEKSLEALNDLSSPEAEVLRDGHAILIKASELTLGDIVVLEAGDRIPADLRIIEGANLKIEEASLTGESVPVDKTSHKMELEDSVIGDRLNMAYMGSAVVYGRAIGAVTSIGMGTEMGRIAGYLSSNARHEETPLQKKLNEMSKYISVLIIIVSAVIFATGLFWGRSAFDMFLTAVSLAVAAIPEGLPAIVTIVLALGVQKMAAKNAIIRRLPAVETLGGTQVICTDKTGTLTKNMMTVMKIFHGGEIFDSCCPNGRDSMPDALFDAMALCNDVRVVKEADGSLAMNGDPTEIALVKVAYDLGIFKNDLERHKPRAAEIPFDSNRKLMTTIHKAGEAYMSYTKGALDILLEKCEFFEDNHAIRPMDQTDRDRITVASASLTKEALRIIGFAYRELPSIPSGLSPEAAENHLIFSGFAGLIDPPRPEVRHAVQICRSAGIKPVMITGDHRDTASAIALDLGIIADDEIVLDGATLEKMSDGELYDIIGKCSVYARVSPEHKVRIVETWRKRGMVTAMTGDGVNDAPALKAADISIGMGITGTDVAKGVSDMVLADDNFATIISAVQEGRMIYANIRKAVHFLLSTHFAEVIVLFIATLLNWQMLVPIHLLWVNLIIDTLPALALGMEAPGKDIMNRKPRRSDQSIFAEGLGIAILIQGIMKGLLILLSYYTALLFHSQSVAMTTAFMTLGLVQLAHAFSLRSDTDSIWKTGLMTNRYLIPAVSIAALLQVMVVVLQPLNFIFYVEQLHWQEWIISIAASISIIPLTELYKAIVGKSKRGK